MNKLRQIFLVILLGLSTAASANKEIIRILAIGNSFSEADARWNVISIMPEAIRGLIDTGNWDLMVFANRQIT